jgi:glycerol-3-phosphate cytidylyltransferase
MNKIILTYGTFDLFHIGHLNLLRRLKQMGDALFVGVSTDEFNALKGKRSLISYENRRDVVQAIRYVDFVFPEDDWEQKRSDILKYKVDTLAMGDDWINKFDHYSDICKVVYVERTHGISSTMIRSDISTIGNTNIEKLRDAVQTMTQIVKSLGA